MGIAKADETDKLTQILERLVENAPVQEIGYGHPKYQERLRAEGFFDEFAKPVYQNGRMADARGLSAETRDRAVKLRPGKYLSGAVEVQVTDKYVQLLYKVATPEERHRFAKVAHDFSDLIDKIWAEMHAA